MILVSPKSQLDFDLDLDLGSDLGLRGLDLGLGLDNIHDVFLTSYILCTF